MGAEAAPDRRVVPFTERDGDYWGPPVDDESAIDEIERVLDGRGGWVVIAWTAFWWLEHYQGLDRYLRSSSASVHEDDCMVAFRIDARTADSHAVALTRS